MRQCLLKQYSACFNNSISVEIKEGWWQGYANKFVQLFTTSCVLSTIVSSYVIRKGKASQDLTITASITSQFRKLGSKKPRLNVIWKSREISCQIKLKLLRTLYVCESWTLTTKPERRVQHKRIIEPASGLPRWKARTLVVKDTNSPSLAT